MPSWSINKIIIEGDKKNVDNYIKKVTTLPKPNDKKHTYPQYIDFEKIIAMPKEMNVSEEEEGHTAFRYLVEKDPKRKAEIKAELEDQCAFDSERINNGLKLGQLYLDNFNKFGARTWYDWSCMHWGCKWNAVATYEWKIENEYKTIASVYCETPWSEPTAAVMNSSKLYKDLIFKLASVSEIDGKSRLAVFEKGVCTKNEVYEEGEPMALLIRSIVLNDQNCLGI